MIDYKKLITKILEENNIEATEEIFERLEKYYEYLVECNKTINLTSIIKKEDVYVKHFADSLLGIKNYKYGATVCDIGTGAGFPGIVLKIARPDLNIILVDSLNKRINFLNKVINELNLCNIQALHYRAEDREFKSLYLNSFDYVIARAVASMNTLAEYCLPYVKVGGSFIAYKSNKIDDEMFISKKCIAELGGKVEKIQNYHLIDDIYRNLVIINKLHKTSDKYPRDKNKPRLDPL